MTKVFTVSELAEEASVSREAVRRAIRRLQIKPCRLAATVRLFSAADAQRIRTECTRAKAAHLHTLNQPADATVAHAG